MGLEFLAPWFLGGTLLLVVPWLVHQVRKPETKPVRFSSLMFVPDIKRDEVQRRRIQHPLLMLLRMLLLLVLAFAFMRPYREIPAAAAAAIRPVSRNVILLDVSMSMQSPGLFEEARADALKLLAQMQGGDRVAVATFAASPRVMAALGDPEHDELGAVAQAREALMAAQPTWESTAYLPALETAESMLKPFENAAVGGNTRLIVHLITDFQHSGMPQEAPSWKLPANIELHTIEVGAAGAANASVTDLAVEEIKGHQLRIRGKVKNWSMPGDKPIAVKLVVNGKEIETKSAAIKPGNANQMMFLMDWNGTDKIEGDLETAGDALPADNQTFFTWNPLEKRRIVLAADAATSGAAFAVAAQVGETAGAKVWEGAKFIQLAVPPDADLPWALRTVPPAQLHAVLAKAGDEPDILVLGDPESIQGQTASDLLAYLQNGGDALLLLNGRIDPAVFDTGFLAGLGMTLSGPRFKAASESNFATLSWVDLDHRIFVPFRGSQYNDFSPLHFYNYQQVALAPPSSSSVAAPRILAKFDDDQPAMIEAAVGKGHLVLWAFGLDPEWTNLPKKSTFVPLLQETLSYMTRAAAKSFTHRVGQTIAGAPESMSGRGAIQVQAPAAKDWAAFDPAKTVGLSQPGFLRWKSAGAPSQSASSEVVASSVAQTAPKGAEQQSDAVNTDPRESDLLRIPVSEFRLRLCSIAPRTASAGANPQAEPGLLEAPMVKHEYGHPFIGMLLALLLLESVYAATLALANDKKAATA